jgi:hypothetical protein
MSRIILGCVLAALLLPAPALAHDGGSIQHKDRYLRATVIRLHGPRAPGCDLAAGKCHAHPHPGWRRVHRYFETLRRLIHPIAYTTISSAGAPRVPPANTASPHYAPSGLASCIVAHESHGNPTATNGQYGGIAQWSAEAWARMGGTRYAPYPQAASYQDQLRVLSDGLSRFGCRDWCPYDGCG